MRKYYPVAALLILLAAIALSASIVTTNANALPTFTLAQKGIGPCVTCHGMAATHDNPKHAAVYPTCSNCHLSGIATPPTPAACAKCHGGPSAILASANHAAQGCGTTPGCHGVPVPTPITTAVSLKVAPTSIKFKKTVKATGIASPAADLAGVKVVLKAEIKVGSAWKAAKAGTATVSAIGAYTWTYKPAKKGTYRMTASIVATADYKGSKSPSRPFTVM